MSKFFFSLPNAGTISPRGSNRVKMPRCFSFSSTYIRVLELGAILWRYKLSLISVYCKNTQIRKGAGGREIRKINTLSCNKTVNLQTHKDDSKKIVRLVIIKNKFLLVFFNLHHGRCTKSDCATFSFQMIIDQLLNICHNPHNIILCQLWLYITLCFYFKRD